MSCLNCETYDWEVDRGLCQRCLDADSLRTALAQARAEGEAAGRAGMAAEAAAWVGRFDPGLAGGISVLASKPPLLAGGAKAEHPTCPVCGDEVFDWDELVPGPDDFTHVTCAAQPQPDVAKALAAIERLDAELSDWTHGEGCSRSWECDEADEDSPCCEHGVIDECPSCDCGKGALGPILAEAIAALRGGR